MKGQDASSRIRGIPRATFADRRIGLPRRSKPEERHPRRRTKRVHSERTLVRWLAGVILFARSLFRRPSVDPTGSNELALRFAVKSKFGEISKIAIRNALFNIATLTFYRFWARTHVRRYLWSRTEMLGEPLEYSGRTAELIIGFIITIIFLGVPIIGLSLAVQFLGGEQPWLVVLYGVGFYLGFFFLYGLAQYRAQRYRLSRTIWRGIRMGLNGSSVPYGLKTLGFFYLAGLSLFWTYPWQRTVLMRQMLANTTFGDRRFAFEGRARALYPAFALAWIMTIIGFIAAIGVFALALALAAEAGYLQGDLQEQIAQAGGLEATMLVTILAATYIFYFVVGIILSFSLAFYRAKEFRYFAECTTLDGLQFRFRANGPSVFWLSAVNTLIVFLTFGAGLPVAQMRRLRFFFCRLSADGPFDMEAVRQSPSPYPWVGEGLAEFFQLGAV